MADAFREMLDAGWHWNAPLKFTAGAAHSITLDPENVAATLEAELDRLSEQPTPPNLIGAAEETAIRIEGLIRMDQWQRPEGRAEGQSKTKSRSRSRGVEH